MLVQHADKRVLLTADLTSGRCLNTLGITLPVVDLRFRSVAHTDDDIHRSFRCNLRSGLARQHGVDARANRLRRRPPVANTRAQAARILKFIEPVANVCSVSACGWILRILALPRRAQSRETAATSVAITEQSTPNSQGCLLLTTYLSIPGHGTVETSPLEMHLDLYLVTV